MSERTDGGDGGKPNWSMDADCDILAYLHSSRTPEGDPSIQSPRVVSLNVEYSATHVNNRLRELSEHESVERVDKGAYRITWAGIALVEQIRSSEELLQIHEPGCHLVRCDCSARKVK
jgi:hypothetical protein